MRRDLVSGITPESVHTAPAPDQKGIGQIIPQGYVTLIHLDEVFPDDVPGSGTLEFTIVPADEPLRMFLPLGAAPTGMVDDQIQHQSGPAAMDRDSQFAELVHTGGAPIEFHQRRVDLSEVLQGVGRAESSEPSERGGGRADGQQVQDAAPQPVDDVRQFGDERAQGSAGWNHRESLLVQRPQDRGVMIFSGRDPVLGPFPEHARERAVHRVGGASPRRVDADAHVGAIGPVLEAFRVDGVGLGLEVAHLGQGQIDAPRPIGFGLQGQVAPRGARQGQFLEMGLQDLLPDPFGPPQVGSKSGLPTGAGLCLRESKGEGQRVSGVSDDTGSRKG